MPTRRTAKVSTGRAVRLFKNGRSQALRIPKEFELPGNEAMITKEGDRLIVQPITQSNRLAALFASWTPLKTEFPEIIDLPVKAEDVF